MTSYARSTEVGEIVEEHDEEGLVVYVASLPDGPIHVLNGVASLIWLEATATDTSVDVVERVAALVERQSETIRGEVDSFLAHLMEMGLLRRVID